MYARSKERERSRSGGRNRHPLTKNSYLFQGRVLCGCERRMSGNRRPNRTYYSCWPQGNNRGAPPPYPGHPRTVYVREDLLLQALTSFLGDRVFGPYRRELFARDLDTADERAAQEAAAERERLRRRRHDVERRQRNLRHQMQDCEPGDPLAVGLREDYNALEEQRKAIEAELARSAENEKAQSQVPRPEDAALLDALPCLALNLAHAPQELLRRLIEVLQVTIRLTRDLDEAQISATLPEAGIAEIAETAERVTETMPNTLKPGPLEGPGQSVDSVRAPNGIRTRATALKGRRPGPLDDEGRWSPGRSRGCSERAGDFGSIWDRVGLRQNR